MIYYRLVGTFARIYLARTPRSSFHRPTFALITLWLRLHTFVGLVWFLVGSVILRYPRLLVVFDSFVLIIVVDSRSLPRYYICHVPTLIC